MAQRLEAKWLCRDEGVCKDWVADELCHDMGTLEGLSGMLGRAEDLERENVKVEDEGVRVWVGHGTRDMVTSFEASKLWMEGLNLKDKEFKAYDGWFHKCRWCSVCGPSEGLVLTGVMQCMRSREKIKSLSPTTSLVGSWPGVRSVHMAVRRRGLSFDSMASTACYSVGSASGVGVVALERSSSPRCRIRRQTPRNPPPEIIPPTLGLHIIAQSSS